MSNLFRTRTVAAVGLVALGLAGCVTHRVDPVVSKAVLDARAHRDVAQAAACPDLSAPISVGFGFGDSSLSELTEHPLTEAAQALSCHPGVQAVVVGQADSHGTESEQQALAQARVTAVVNGLRSRVQGGLNLQIQIGGKPPEADGKKVVILAEGRRW